MRLRSAASGLAGLPVLIGFIGMLASCGTESPTAQGGGFGGETVSGLVVGVSGRGIGGAAVRLRESGSLESAALRIGATDSTGFFRVGLPEGNAFRLEVAGREGNDSVRALIDVGHGQSPGRILAEAGAPRRVRLRDRSGKPVAAVLQGYGLGRSVPADDSGFADLSDWPPADLWVRAALPNGGVNDLFVPAHGGEIEVGAGWLVDDFEGGGTHTRLGSLIGGGWWYVASQGTDSQSTRDIALARDTLDARGGRTSLRAGFSFLAQQPVNYGLIGFHFGPTSADTVDLSGLDSLEFWIKGNGGVRVEFVADTGGGVTSHYVALQTDSVWTRRIVTSAQLAPNDAGRSWATDSKRVRLLQFIVFQNTEFRLDDLRYYGKARP